MLKHLTWRKIVAAGLVSFGAFLLPACGNPEAEYDDDDDDRTSQVWNQDDDDDDFEFDD